MRDLKAAKADKAEVDAAVAALLKAKADFTAAGGVIEAPASSGKKKKKEAAPAPAAAPAAEGGELSKRREVFPCILAG